MSTTEILTLIIAIYGAVVSTILGLRELQRDRKRISVILDYVVSYERAQVTITNIGHRPITIAEMRLEIKGKGESFWDPVPRNALFAPEVNQEPFPFTLGDGEHRTLPLSEGIHNIFLEEGVQVKMLVYDVEGKEYNKFKVRIYDPKWGYYRKIGR